MDQEIKDKSKELVVNAIDFIQRSGDFVAEQAPLVVQEFLLWRFTQATLWASIELVVFAVCVWYCRRYIKPAMVELDKPTRDQSDLVIGRGVIGGIAAIITGFICFVAAMFNVVEAVQIKLAPRVYMLEELSKYIN